MRCAEQVSLDLVCLSFIFYCCINKMFQQKQLKRKWFILTTIPGYTPSLVGSHCSKNLKEPIPLYSQSQAQNNERINSCWCLAYSLSPLCSVFDLWRFSVIRWTSPDKACSICKNLLIPLFCESSIPYQCSALSWKGREEKSIGDLDLKITV